MTNLRAQIEATIPSDSDGRRDWCKAAIETIAEVILDHVEGSVPDAARGLDILMAIAIARLPKIQQGRTRQ